MQRTSGVLLAVSSLPSAHGIGCFDEAAYRFVDFLYSAKQSCWQILPLGPTAYGGSGDSPYQSYSAFAGNPYFISLDALVKEGVLTSAEVDAVDFGSDPGDVDYEKLHNGRFALLRKAYERSDITKDDGFNRFAAENAHWLNDYALFMALHNFFGTGWQQWPEDIRCRWQYSIDYYNTQLYFDIEFEKYLQYKFFTQWKALRTYANQKDIRIVGDIPIYVSMDSADVWANPGLFQLSDGFAPQNISGCPPDSFSADGQIWGNPLYRWDVHRADGFGWWVSRMRQSFALYDIVRIDHFRGLDEYFSIPADAKTAIAGHWEPGPGMDLFHAIEYALGRHPIIAEDLGFMTDGVRQLVRSTGYPNMKVIQFGFGAGDVYGTNEHLPHYYGKNCVAYTGTHDNDTLAGWLAGAEAADLSFIRTYLGDDTTPDDRLWQVLLARTLSTAAETCMVPIQDWLGLGTEHRMNKPGTVGQNWRWRVSAKVFTPALAQFMATLTARYGRANGK